MDRGAEEGVSERPIAVSRGALSAPGGQVEWLRLRRAVINSVVDSLSFVRLERANERTKPGGNEISRSSSPPLLAGVSALCPFAVSPVLAASIPAPSASSAGERRWFLRLRACPYRLFLFYPDSATSRPVPTCPIQKETKVEEEEAERYRAGATTHGAGGKV